jgi:hypothetical protein
VPVVTAVEASPRVAGHLLTDHALDAAGACPPHRRVDAKTTVEYEPFLWDSGVVTRPPVSPAAGSPDGAVRPVGDGAGAGADGSAPAESGGGWLVPLVVLVAGMFMSVLDISIVNVAIPTIQNEFGATTEDVQWVVTAYTLTLGVVVPVTAWLGDRFGLARVYILTLLNFAAGSALCGLAWDLHGLIAFRIIQAIPGGILPVITLSMLYRIVPRGRLGAAMGLYGLVCNDSS